MIDEFNAMNSLNDQQRVIFMNQMATYRKSEVVAILLAFFLGSFGAHKFYMGETGWGILYLCFCWTFIPHLIAFVECFLLPGRVRSYNIRLAHDIATRVRVAYPSPGFVNAPMYPA